MFRRVLIPENLKILDSLRGLAAIYVLVGHARWLLWEGYNEGYLRNPGDYTLLDRLLMYFFTIFKYGHEAVLFFFVLSGFVIHLSVSKKRDMEGKLDIRDYLFRRFRRIYPPLVMALLLTFALDQVGLFFKLPIYYSNTPYSSINWNVQPTFGWEALVGNLTFLQRVYTPVWGSNGALWSLMYEWWFYLLYIPTSWAFRKNKMLTSLGILLLWTVNIEYQVGPALYTKVMSYFITWYLGMLLADCLIYKRNLTLFSFYLVFLLLLSSLRYFEGIGREIDLTIGIVVFLFLSLTGNKFSWLQNFSKLGDFSFTLYIIHLPLICLLSGFLMKSMGGFLPHHFYYAFLGIVLSLLIAWACHFLVERPFMKKRTSG